MKRFSGLVLLFAALSFQTIAQVRYLEPITDEVLTETYTYVSKDGENLDLDVYRPEYDAETTRPTLIYVHGGGFQQGTTKQ